jgi:uncharacterized membrane protein YphA (DoxX/SURF4 family)
MDLLEKHEGFMSRLNSWSEAHRKSIVFAVLRILLGGLLLVTAVIFIKDNKLPTILYNSSGFGSWLFSSLIITMQITGGFMIGIGLKTRDFSIAMIPMLIGAVIMGALIHDGLILSAVTLLGVLFFAIFNSGYYSADTAINKEIEEEEKFFNR